MARLLKKKNDNNPEIEIDKKYEILNFFGK